MVNTINPADAKPGEVYEGTVHGAERTVLVRRNSSDCYPWESLSEVLDHEDVSDLVRLVPARPVTRDDLPDQYAAYSKIARPDCGDLTPSDLGPLLDAVVEHLNANGGVPAPDLLSSAADCVLDAEDRAKDAKAEAARWRRAHGIVEQERDQARESLHEACKVAQSYKVDAYQATERAEAAEARTTPAVTRADIEKAIRGKVWAASREPNKAGFHRVHVDWATDAVWSLVSGDDPAVFVVRESDVAAVEVERDSHGEWFADGEHVYALGAAYSRNLAGCYMQKAVRRLAVARAIEQDAATDPVEAKAEEFYDVAYPDDPDGWTHQADMHRDPFRRLAAHVLGQEAGDE